MRKKRSFATGRSVRSSSHKILIAVLAMFFLLSSASPIFAGAVSSPAHVDIAIIQLVEHPALDAAREGFIDGLKERGYSEGENLTLSYANAQGDQANAQTIAIQFAAQDYDLILAIATTAAQAIANAISDTPVLITAVTDAAASGLVDSNEAPGGNITGTSDMSPIAEQIDLLTQLVPTAERVAILYASSEANSKIQADVAAEALTQKGLDHRVATASSSNELQQVVESVIGDVDAIYIPTDNMFANSMAIVKQVTENAGVPVMAGEENMMQSGALATVSIDYYELGSITADMAYRILEEGADPSVMPIEYQPDPKVIINMDNARAIKLPIPEDLDAERYSATGDYSSVVLTPEELESSRTRESGLAEAVTSGISQGLLWAIMALGVYITFRLLKISDLTVDGSFTTGGAIAAMAIISGIHPIFATVLALIAGVTAGFITGFLTTRMHIPALLSSILTQIALYSINLRIMNGPNIPLLRQQTIFTTSLFGLPAGISNFVLGLLIVALFIILMYSFFGTEIGAAIRATGSNSNMVRALGTNTANTTMLGLMLGNGLVATSGGLVAQQQGYADIGMGTGAIVIGLAAIVIGEALFFRNNFWLRLSGVVLGSVIYRIVVTFILRWDPIQASDLKLFTAILVALALFLPEVIGRSRTAITTRRNRHA